MILLAVSAHGASGTWVDEVIELGIPLIVFAVLWWWSTRKQKDKRKPGGATKEREEGS